MFFWWEICDFPIAMQNKWYSGTDSEKMVMLLIERKIHEALWDIYKIIFHPFPPGDFSRCQPVGFTGFLFYTNRRWRGVIFIRGKVGDVFPGERVRGLEARRVWQGFCVTMCVIGGWWVDEVKPGNDFKQLVFGDACFSFFWIMSRSWRCFNLKPTTLVMRDVALHVFLLF